MSVKLSQFSLFTLLLGALLSSLNTFAQAVKIHEGPSFQSGICEPSISVDPYQPHERLCCERIWTTFTKVPTAGSLGSKKKYPARMAFGATLVLSPIGTGAFIISTSAIPRAPIGAATRSSTAWSVKQKTDQEARLPTALLLPLMEKKHDKEWAAIHPTKGTIALSWTQFDAYGTSDENCKSTILFSESNDGGQSWSEPVVITEQQGRLYRRRRHQ